MSAARAPRPVPLTLALRRFLYGTAAITGAAILVVEILGAKMLSPYVGTSHFVWTAQIAVTLVSLAAGYWLGGWMVDRSTELRRLYSCVLLAGLYLCATVPFAARVAFACLHLPLALGSLLASLFLFFVPLTLLATVGPFAIRVLTTGLADVGGVAGRLTAVSTLGSLLGTLLVGYVLLPLLPNSVTMWATAGVLMALAVIYFAVWRGPVRRAVALLALGLGAGWLANEAQRRPWSGDLREVAQANSNFGLMQVLDTTDGARRYYLNDYLPQNTYDPARQQSASLFTYGLYGLARIHTARIDDALCIGVGIGIVPAALAREGARVEAVEINDAILPLARAHFHLESAGWQVTIGDGRPFLNRTTRQYDAIVLDAFLGDSAPSHLMTREAFTAMRRVLRPEGVLVINSLGDFAPGRDFLTASLHRTLGTVFGAVEVRATGNGNVFFVATPAAVLTRHRQLDFEEVHPDLRDPVRSLLAEVRGVDPSHGLVLTDDFNPVEFHDARNREEMRRGLVQWMHPVLPF